jgi:hypothetical protein
MILSKPTVSLSALFYISRDRYNMCWQIEMTLKNECCGGAGAHSLLRAPFRGGGRNPDDSFDYNLSIRIETNH